MMIFLRLLAAISILASLVGLGLSAMASDEMSRAADARRLQLLVLAWLVVSIATPVVESLAAWGNPSLGRLIYLPVIVLAAWSILSLHRF